MICSIQKDHYVSWFCCNSTCYKTRITYLQISADLLLWRACFALAWNMDIHGHVPISATNFTLAFELFNPPRAIFLRLDPSSSPERKPFSLQVPRPNIFQPPTELLEIPEDRNDGRLISSLSCYSHVWNPSWHGKRRPIPLSPTSLPGPSRHFAGISCSFGRRSRASKVELLDTKQISI